MFISETQVRIHYALTDQMGVMYHGHYAQLYEISRTEAIRKLGFTYKSMEAMGIIMPVVELHSKFLRPAKYDDLVTIKTILKELPLHHKVTFHHEVYNEQNELLNTASIVLFFLQAKTMKKAEIPQALKSVMEKYFI